MRRPKITTSADIHSTLTDIDRIRHLIARFRVLATAPLSNGRTRAANALLDQALGMDVLEHYRTGRIQGRGDTDGTR